MSATQVVWTARCVTCLVGGGTLDGDRVECEVCGATIVSVDGVWRALPPDRVDRIERFLADYTSIRRAEGRGSEAAEYYLRLPGTTIGDPLAWQWSMRATTWAHLRDRILPGLGRELRVVDVGCGVGWLSHRLSELGHHPVAVDVSVDAFDGLGASRHLGGSWPRLQADFDVLPLTSGQADVVLYNASLHYSTDYEATLAEACRVMRPGGVVVVLDSPIYRRPEAGAQMVRERRADFEARFGTRSDSVPSLDYLTEAGIDEMGATLGLRWTRHPVWYGWSWWLRPAKARVHRRREPARFAVLVGRRPN